MLWEKNIKVTYWAPHEAFFSYMNLAIYSGFCLSFPVIMSQIWAFIAPGLYTHEKKAFLPFLLMTPIMFILGAMMAYYVVLPTALSFFAGFQTPLGTMGGTQIVQETRVSEYLSFALSFILIFGATFELPIGLILAGRVGLISATTLREKRSYAIFAIAVFAALVTPPDMISMAGLGIPLYIMFEISILSIASFEKKRDKEIKIMNDGIK